MNNITVASGRANFSIGDIAEVARRQAKIAEHFAAIMDELDIDHKNDPQTQGTPQRVAKMLFEVCAGRYQEPPEITTFPVEERGGLSTNNELMVVGPIQFESLCAHHFVPIIGHAFIAYLPKDRLAGLSKFSRVVKYFGERPQIQEEMTSQVYNFLWDILDPMNLAVVVEAVHFCVYWRGVKDRSSFTTSHLSDGILMTPALRNEVFQLIDRRRRPILT